MLSDVAFLYAPTIRSRAYAQAMAQRGVLPSLAFRIPGPEQRWSGSAVDYLGLRFDPAVPVEETLSVPAASLTASDVNSAAVVQTIAAIPQSVVVYSGLPGVLLKGLLDTGKRFLHIHGGAAPEYRGPTAFYFSILKEGTIGATAMFLDRGIDTGPIVGRKVHKPAPMDIDYIVDPMIRADLLCDVLSVLAKGEEPPAIPQQTAGTTYHVIHPVLKHLALRSIR